MGKNKLTDETMVVKCSKANCEYNEKGFCHMTEVILDEHARCIYRYNKKEGTNND